MSSFNFRIIVAFFLMMTRFVNYAKNLRNLYPYLDCYSILVVEWGFITDSLYSLLRRLNVSAYDTSVFVSCRYSEIFILWFLKLLKFSKCLRASACLWGFKILNFLGGDGVL